MIKYFKTPQLVKWVFPNRLWSFSVSDNSVFLTFDDGPDPEITPYVLDWLKEHDLKATFFCVGGNIEKEPILFARIKAEGHAIGNHTQNHAKGTSTRTSEYLEQFKKGFETTGSRLFRPPYGRIKANQAKEISKDHHIIMWNWLSYDYDNEVSIEEIKSKMELIEAGDVLVFHDNKKSKDRLKELLPQLLVTFQEKNLATKVISEELCKSEQ